MARKENAALNGVFLSDVDPRILSIRIQEQAQQDETSFESRGKLPGQTLVFKRRAGLTVQIYFKIRELNDLSARMQVIGKVNQWAAKGGKLSVSYRSGQTLNVSLIQPASPGDIRSYNNELSLIFVSDGWPYWLDPDIITRQISGQNIITHISVSGDAPTTIDVSARFTKAPTFVDLYVNDTAIRLSGLSLSNGSAIAVTHAPNGVASIKCGEESLFAHLSDDSADCLTAISGPISVRMESDGEADITLTAQGRWS